MNDVSFSISSDHDGVIRVTFNEPVCKEFAEAVVRNGQLIGVPKFELVQLENLSSRYIAVIHKETAQ